MKLPSKSFYQSLPTKRMASGALFFDQQNRILVVEPTYKSVWEIPGGTVEANESPRQAVEREVYEELSLQKEIRDLLCLDYVSETETNTESLQFIYWGGELTAEEISRIVLPADELKSFAFKTISELEPILLDRLYRRIQQVIKAQHALKFMYLEDQVLP